jgi:hypothetical protein
MAVGDGLSPQHSLVPAGQARQVLQVCGMRFWELAGGLEPPTCCLQDSSGPSTACWRVASLQLRPDGSSSQYAPVGPSDAVWNDKWNDMDGGLRQPTAASQNPLEVGWRPEDT